MLWNVMLNNTVIKTVWFVSAVNAEFVKNALVIHEHYDFNIVVIPA